MAELIAPGTNELTTPTVVDAPPGDRSTLEAVEASERWPAGPNSIVDFDDGSSG